MINIKNKKCFKKLLLKFDPKTLSINFQHIYYVFNDKLYKFILNIIFNN